MVNLSSQIQKKHFKSQSAIKVFTNNFLQGQLQQQAQQNPGNDQNLVVGNQISNQNYYNNNINSNGNIANIANIINMSANNNNFNEGGQQNQQNSDVYMNTNGTNFESSSPKQYKNNLLQLTQKQNLSNYKQKKIERLKTEEDEQSKQTNSYFSSIQRIKTETNRKQRTLFKIQRNYSKNQLQQNYSLTKNFFSPSTKHYTPLGFLGKKLQ
eukprot:TRINITY_DN2619_c0_g1_i2.p1 TRINITY_DN2619_c0_g1~~TRINITY_DN2619_c0_g1_i2.p1  ORF type:complete len:211 (-),score=42.66 TRINITY_DN2619_c0_g1_i2:8-640(-)